MGRSFWPSNISHRPGEVRPRLSSQLGHARSNSLRRPSRVRTTLAGIPTSGTCSFFAPWRRRCAG